MRKILALTLLVFVQSAMATEIPPYTEACREDDPQFKTKGRDATVKLAADQHGQPLLNNPIDCPKEGSCGWRTDQLLKDGTLVFAGRSRKGYTCVSVNGETKLLGWVPTKQLKFPRSKKSVKSNSPE